MLSLIKSNASFFSWYSSLVNVNYVVIISTQYGCDIIGYGGVKLPTVGIHSISSKEFFIFTISLNIL